LNEGANLDGGGMRTRRTHPLVLAGVIVAIFTTVGFAVASTQSGKLHENLQLAALTLLYGALLGGVVKLLLDDFHRTREERFAQGRFMAAMLDDLKSVYDRVERVRILTPAHRAALTYGKEMRDLIDARVQLRNVVRALDLTTSGMPDDALVDLKVAVGESYLGRLTAEFQLRYKPIADKQKVYEARVKKALESVPVANGSAAALDVVNEAWTDIARLPEMNGFIGTWRGSKPSPSHAPPDYELNFEGRSTWRASSYATSSRPSLAKRGLASPTSIEPRVIVSRKTPAAQPRRPLPRSSLRLQ